MNIPQRSRRSVAVIAAAATVSLALAACATGGDSAAETDDVFVIYGEEVPFNQELYDMLPDDVKEKGSLSFSTDAAGPPRTFVDDSGEIVGVIPDVIHAVGATLGLETEILKNSFDAEVPGVESGRFDFTTGTGDFPHRREILDLIDYYKAGRVYLVQAGNPMGVTKDELTQCGLRVGVLKGTTQEQLVTELSQRCEDEGLEPINLQSFNNVLLPVPLEADRVDVVWENTSTGMMVAEESPDKFELADVLFQGYVAFGLRKDRPELRDTMQQTLQHLMDTGVYQTIYDEWGQGELVMDYISINSDNRDLQ
ncbi:ABC transporter substrate-binding protein [Microbacterium sp.]|uniref:ABC transporter substrate-binding protein n=1 Tax=Microbacterium sp. TaxID=51671 RepID=UPI003A843ACD